MQKHILRAALLLSLLLAFAKPLLASNVTLIMPGQNDTTAPAQLTPGQYPPQPALFKFTNGNATVYLFGTAHYMTKGVKWRTNEFNRALAHADHIWFETTYREMSNPVSFLDFAASMKNKDNKRLEDILSRDEMAKLTTVARKQNIDIDLYSELHPWVIAILLGWGHPENNKKTPHEDIDYAAGVERIIESSRLGKPISPIETMQELTMRFSELSPEDEKIFLLNTLEDVEASQKDTLTEMISTWSTGDMRTLSAMGEGVKKQTPGFYRSIVTERNKTMFNKIVTLLHGNGTQFVGVGALHIAGPGGLVNMLEQAGYKGERIYDTEPPVSSDTERKIPWPKYRLMLLQSMRMTVGLLPGHNPDEVLLRVSHNRSLSGCIEISPLKTKVLQSESMVDVDVWGYWHNIHPYPDTDGCGSPIKHAAVDVPLNLAELKKNKTTTLKLTSPRGMDFFTLVYKDGTLTLTPEAKGIIFVPDLKKLALTGL